MHWVKRPTNDANDRKSSTPTELHNKAQTSEVLCQGIGGFFPQPEWVAQTLILVVDVAEGNCGTPLAFVCRLLTVTQGGAAAPLTLGCAVVCLQHTKHASGKAVSVTLCQPTPYSESFHRFLSHTLIQQNNVLFYINKQSYNANNMNEPKARGIGYSSSCDSTVDRT